MQVGQFLSRCEVQHKCKFKKLKSTKVCGVHQISCGVVSPATQFEQVGPKNYKCKSKKLWGRLQNQMSRGDW